MLTIVVPVKNPPDLALFIQANKQLLSKYPLIVIDSGKGKELAPLASTYLEKELSLWEARKLGYSQVKSPFILNLDSDVVLPEGYVEKALRILTSNENVGAVSIFFITSKHRGVLEFGASVWRTSLLKKLYDYNPQSLENNKVFQLSPNKFVIPSHGYCECLYMWEKLERTGFKLEPLPCRAVHLKS